MVTRPDLAISAPLNDSLLVKIDAGSTYTSTEIGFIAVAGSYIIGEAYEKNDDNTLGEWKYSVAAIIPADLTPGLHSIRLTFTPVKKKPWNYTVLSKYTPFSLENVNVYIITENESDQLAYACSNFYDMGDGNIKIPDVRFNSSADAQGLTFEYAYLPGHTNENPRNLGLTYSSNPIFQGKQIGCLAFRILDSFQNEIFWSFYEGISAVPINKVIILPYNDYSLRTSTCIFDGGSSRLLEGTSISTLPTEPGIYTQSIEFKLRGACFDPDTNTVVSETLPFTYYETVTFRIPEPPASQEDTPG